MTTCDYCGMDPGPHPVHSLLWFGIRDTQTNQKVCMACKPRHYKQKRYTSYGATVAESNVIYRHAEN